MTHLKIGYISYGFEQKIDSPPIKMESQKC